MATLHAVPAPVHLTFDRSTTDLVRLLLASLPSAHTRRSYDLSFRDLEKFADGEPITAKVLVDWRSAMAARMSIASANVRLVAIRTLVDQAQSAGLLAGDAAAAMRKVRGLPSRGSRGGVWLTPEQVRALLDVPDRTSLRGKRNFCVLAVLLGCALRRYELAGLDLKRIQQRDGRWIISDLDGKGGRVRSIAIPPWVKHAIDEWTEAAGIHSGPLLRCLTADQPALGAFSIWKIVNRAAEKIGIDKLGPHDLRRTAAKLCRTRGGDIEQIKFMLGHASIQTTERYLGTAQNFVSAVNDDQGIW